MSSMKLDEWKALYIRTYRAYEVSKPDADTRYRLDAILDHLHSIKPTPASQDADSPSTPDSPKASFTPMQALYEAPLVTGDPNQPLSVLYCEALIFTLGVLSNEQLAELFDDVRLKSDVALGSDSLEMLQLSQSLQLLYSKLQAIATKRYNLNHNCSHLVHILSN